MRSETLRAVQASFARAAASYDAAAVLQREIAQRLSERLDGMRLNPQRILDVGSGTGFARPLLAARFPLATRLAFDLAPAMLQYEREHARARFGAFAQAWKKLQAHWRGARTHYVCADMHALPCATASVDLIWSNVALQWSDAPQAVFEDCRRILRPEGLLLFSTFGPDTLQELGRAFAAVDGEPHVNRFVDMHDLGDALLAAGFTGPVMEMERIVLTYADLKSVLRDLQDIGAHTVLERQRVGLMGRARWQALQAAYARFKRVDGRLPATFEVIYGHAWAGTPQIPKHPQGALGQAGQGEAVLHWHANDRLQR